MGEVAEACQDAVPDGGAQERVQGKGEELHVGKPGRYRNQLSDDRDEPSDKCGNGSVVAEVVFGLFNLLGVDKQEMP